MFHTSENTIAALTKSVKDVLLTSIYGKQEIVEIAAFEPLLLFE